MPSKKKKYNARFPAGRIKKIMQTDEEVGKVAQAVPVIISRTLELFVESLLTKSAQITQARNAKTLTPSHMKQCILSESRFDFLKDLVKNIPDATTQEDNEVPLDMTTDYTSGGETPTTTTTNVSIPPPPPLHPAPIPLIHNPIPPASSPVLPAANFYTEQQQIHQQSSTTSSCSSSSNSTLTSKPTTVIQYGATKTDTTTTTTTTNPIPNPKIDFSIKSLVKTADDDGDEAASVDPKIHIDLTNIIRQPPCQDVPPLIPLARNSLYQGNNDNLCIDEDYDT